MLRDWVPPIRTGLGLTFLVYWVGSMLVASRINDGTERITNPVAALVIAVACALAAALFIGPLVSLHIRTLVIRPNAEVDRVGFLVAGLLGLAFSVGFVYVAVQGGQL